MGTMREEMEKIMNDWENDRYIHMQPKEQNQVQHTQPQTESTKTITASGNPMGTRGPGTFSYEVLDYVQKNPGCTGVQVRDAMLIKFPKQRVSQAASTLKQLTDTFYVTRKETRVGLQKSFFYEAVPLENRKSMMQRAKENKRKLQANAAKAREAWASKRAAALQAEAAAVATKMPTVQLPLTPSTRQPVQHAAMVEAPVQPKQETSAISIRLTLSIAGQDVRVTVQEAVQLHRQLSEFLGLGG